MKNSKTNNINLNVRAVNKLLKILQSDDVVVNVSADLKEAMEAVRGKAVRANALTAVQATNVLFILLRTLVVRAS